MFLSLTTKQSYGWKLFSFGIFNHGDGFVPKFPTGIQLWGLIYNHYVCTKQGWKDAYATPHRRTEICRNKLDRRMHALHRKSDSCKRTFLRLEKLAILKIEFIMIFLTCVMLLHATKNVYNAINIKAVVLSLLCPIIPDPFYCKRSRPIQIITIITIIFVIHQNQRNWFGCMILTLCPGWIWSRTTTQLKAEDVAGEHRKD